MSKTTATPTTATFATLAEKPTLEQAQKIVGGYVEMITSRVDSTKQILANEEGLIHNLPFNESASNIAGVPLVGNVIILTGKARW